MTIAVRNLSSDGVFAIFDEATDVGDVLDIDAARNAPAKTPASHLAKLYFHSSLDMLEVFTEGTTGISHAATSAGTTATGANKAWEWNTASADHLLATHNLGYEPLAMVAYDDNILWPGMPVQTNGVGGGRYVSFYVTTTQLRLREWSSSGSSGLSSTSLDYDYLIFRAPRTASGSELAGYNATTGILQLAFDRFNSGRKYLQIASGGSPFGLSLGKTIDLDNGAIRAVRPDGTTYEPVPADLACRVQPGTGTFGSAMGYGGSFTGDGAIQVQAP